MTTDWVQQLDRGKGHRGSRPRCVLLTDGDGANVARRLTRLVDLPGVVVSTEDCWQPCGRPVLREDSWDTTPSDEVDLATPNDLVSPLVRRRLRSWWLAVPTSRTRTPVWDLAATCTVRGTSGILLIEAKAHDEELSAAGKAAPTSPNGWRNHERIGDAIGEANDGLDLASSRSWALSRDSHYQLSNRFAWAWKLASFGVPVVLVYLGFLHADEISDLGRTFSSHDEWKAVLMRHSGGIVDPRSWGEWIDVGGTPMIALARAYDRPLGTDGHPAPLPAG